MVVAREPIPGTIEIVDRIKEMVQLNAHLSSERMISEQGAEIAFCCLDRFRQRLQDIPPSHIRAVATDTLRSAHNGELVLRGCEQALGHSISVISGHEEARLVYKGASS